MTNEPPRNQEFYTEDEIEVGRDNITGEFMPANESKASPSKITHHFKRWRDRLGRFVKRP